jgi:hypothetical protein
MFHVLAYQGSSHDIVGLDATPIPDDIFTIQNGHFLPQYDLQFYGGYFGGSILSYVQLVTPTTRQISIPRLVPINAAVVPVTNPNMVDLRLNPLRLRAVEEISLLNTLGTNAGNQPFINVLFVGKSLDPIPQGDILTLHGTSTTAAVVNAWTSLAITYDNTLPAGTYAIIGAQVQSTNAIAHRFIFKDQWLRPGFLSVSSATNRLNWDYYRGAMGLLGTFTTTTYPTLQVLCASADATHDVTFSIIRVG